jgi:hypothetical protein
MWSTFHLTKGPDFRQGPAIIADGSPSAPEQCHRVEQLAY